jgi:thiol-disulfide isomerase/thioredoxin
MAKQINQILVSLSLVCLAFACLSEGPGVDGLKSTDDTISIRSDYPNEPYGKTEGEVIKNVAFVSADGSAFDFKKIYQNPLSEVLLLTTSAEWCSACIKEQPKLEEFYQRYKDRGLEVLVSLFEDANFEPATQQIAQRWRDKYALSFHVVADTIRPSAMSAYYDVALTPMVMMIDLKTMKIIYLNQGFDVDVVTNLIESSLPPQKTQAQQTEILVKNRLQYPPEPYGFKVGDVIASESLTNIDGSTFELKDIFSQKQNKLLLLTTSAEWCSACIKEQPKLQSFYEQYHDQGLDLVVSLFQDSNFEPATITVAQRWKEKYALDFHVVADTSNPSTMGKYYDVALTPMIMLIDVATMKIIYLAQGFDQDTVTGYIQTNLNIK